MANRFVVDFGGEEEIPEPESSRTVGDVMFFLAYSTLAEARNAATFYIDRMKTPSSIIWARYHPPDSLISWFGFGFDRLQPFMKGEWIDAISYLPIPPEVVEAWNRSGYDVHDYTVAEMRYFEELKWVEFP